jgi:hypothetical protein
MWSIVLTSVLSSGAAIAVFSWVAQRVFEHALSRSLADRRAAFETSLEERRQSFSRELETQRQAAQQALEGFKAQLTLEAEVRRQAAAKKVEMLLRMVGLANSLIRRVAFVTDPNREKIKEESDDAIAAMDEYWGLTREAEAFFEGETWIEMHEFGREIQENAQRFVGELLRESFRR